MEEDRRPERRPHPAPGREGQFLGHGRYRPLRALLRGALPPGRPHSLRGGAGGAAVSRTGLRLRPVARDLESRLHAVQPVRLRGADAAAQALHRHGHGARARRGSGAGKAIGLRHRSLPPDHQSRRAYLEDPLRSGRRARRLHAGDRRPRPRRDLPHHGRGDALQRMARLCPAADHAAGHAPRTHARAHRALLVGRHEDRGGDHGPRLSRDRGGAGAGGQTP